MTYTDLLAAMATYGSHRDDVCRHCLNVEPEQIRPTVILAPWWEPSSMPALGEATLLTDPHASTQGKVWEITRGEKKFTYIKTGVGAPNFADAMLGLGVTPCRRALFLGSVGALDRSMDIGDLVLPHTAVTGDGVGRYLCGNALFAQDNLGELTYPTHPLWEQAKELCAAACQATAVGFHTAKVYSVDSIFAQFYHLPKIMDLGCTVIDMETAAFFRCAALMGLESTAFFVVSDNTLRNQSLVSGRTSETEARRKLTRKQLLPSVLSELIL